MFSALVDESPSSRVSTNFAVFFHGFYAVPSHRYILRYLHRGDTTISSFRRLIRENYTVYSYTYRVNFLLSVDYDA